MRGEMRGRMERAQGWRARTDGERAERCAGGMEGAQGGMECLREGMAGAQRGGMLVCWGMERWREGMEGARRAPRRGGSTAHPPAGTRSPQRRGRPRGWGRGAGRSGGGGSPKSVRSPWEAMLRHRGPVWCPCQPRSPTSPTAGFCRCSPRYFLLLSLKLPGTPQPQSCSRGRVSLPSVIISLCSPLSWHLPWPHPHARPGVRCLSRCVPCASQVTHLPVSACLPCAALL